MKARFYVASAVCAIALRAGTAAADDASRAEELFRSASSAYARGEFSAAAIAFEEAHQLAPRGPTVLNAARAWEAGKEPARAADDYEAALKIGGLTDAEAKLAAERLAFLEADLGVLSVEGPPGSLVTVAHRERAATPTRIHLPPGAHALAALFRDGSRQSKSITIERAATLDLRLVPPSSSRSPARKRKPPPPPKPPKEPPSRTQRTLGFVLVGAGAVASGAAIYLGLRALDARDRYDESQRRDVDAYDSAKSLRLWTNVAWAGAAALGGTGIVLVATAPGQRDVGMLYRARF